MPLSRLRVVDDARKASPQLDRGHGLTPLLIDGADAEVARLAAERDARLAEYQRKRDAAEAAERAAAIAEAQTIWR